MSAILLTFNAAAYLLTFQLLLKRSDATDKIFTMMEEHYEFKKKRKTKYEKIVEFALNGMLFSCVNVVRPKGQRKFSHAQAQPQFLFI